MDGELTRAMVMNAITMLVAEFTETGYGAEDLLTRIGSLANFAAISDADRRAVELVGWEEGTLFRLAGGVTGPAELASVAAAARLLSFSAAEIRNTTVGMTVERLGLVHNETTPDAEIIHPQEVEA